MYKVIVRFVDLQDDNHVYCVGDVFPRTGKHVSDERIAELAGTENRRKVALIKADVVEEPKVEVVEETSAEVVEEPKEEKATRNNKKK